MESLRTLVHQNPVVIFTNSSCCMSHSVIQLVRSYGANATVYELDRMPKGEEISCELGKMGNTKKHSLPAVFVGNEFIGGAKEVFALQIQGKLLPMLKEARAIWV